MTRWTLLAATCLVLLTASHVAAEEGKLTVVEKAPAGVGDKVAAALNPSGQHITAAGGAIGTVWLVKQLEAKADFKPSLSVKYPLTPGQLVGAIEVVKKSEFTDFRGQDVAAGIYTLRYGQQPFAARDLQFRTEKERSVRVDEQQSLSVGRIFRCNRHPV